MSKGRARRGSTRLRTRSGWWDSKCLCPAKTGGVAAPRQQKRTLRWPKRARAIEHRTEILGAKRKIEAAKARRTLAKRAWIPDPELRLEARQFNGAGGGIQEYDTGVFFGFPWVQRGKYKAAIAEAENLRESSEHELAAVEAETLAMVRTQIETVETLHH